MPPPLRMLITAAPGTGKTTLCDKVAKRFARLPERAFLQDGFLCYEQRGDSGKRVGFELVSLDGTARKPLASIDGPKTGHRVGQYEVQVEQFESLALPILQKMVEAKGKRLLVFDEIGKMELFSDKFQDAIRALLNSEDEELHILGTVAIKGPGLIEESKKLRPVEVCEISKEDRDKVYEQVTERFAVALGEVLPAEEAAPVEAVAPPPGELPGPEDFTFAEAPAPGCFTPVYPKDPGANLASMNAGDYFLYVGGSAINRAFSDALWNAGQDPREKFEYLHKALLDKASEKPGELCWLRPEMLHPKSWRDWALTDVQALCGLVPAAVPGLGSTDAQLAEIRPVGLVALTVFPSRKRPCGSDQNVGMVYTVGPNCGPVRKKGRRDCDRLSVEQFQRVLESLGHAVGATVAGYNRQRLEAGGSPAPPRIDVTRVCLVSGGVYKHPDASKEQVAAALLRGLAAAHQAGGEHSPRCDFAWDDDVFKTAWEKMLAASK